MRSNTTNPTMTEAISFIAADWPAPARVRALTTLRAGGVSRGGFAGLNLADHVGDEAQAVAHNRALLQTQLRLPRAPVWLQQVHGVAVVDAAQPPAHAAADGSYSARAGVVCAVLSADCLPVLICDRAGTRVAAVHAGWRGLLNGVIEAGVAALQQPPQQVLAWLGPAIGPRAFVVGAEVRAAFIDADAAAAAAFVPQAAAHWHADLYALARQRLQRLGVHAVFGGGFCTWHDSTRFFSYRREPQCGRMASLIWLDPA